jgi:hypothetical protein
MKIIEHAGSAENGHGIIFLDDGSAICWFEEESIIVHPTDGKLPGLHGPLTSLPVGEYLEDPNNPYQAIIDDPSAGPTREMTDAEAQWHDYIFSLFGNDLGI